MTTIKKPLNRKFCTLPEDSPLKIPKYRSSVLSRNVDCPKLIKYIDDNIIGRNTSFLGPFGRRKIVYCDYTASGRGLQFIEDYILREVLPLYGNTHTSTNITALQSTLFRHEARDIIRNAAHASEDDAVIFAGHGCTGAIHKLIHALKLKDSSSLVILVGSSEHHSVLLPWREVGAKVIRIAETRDGFLDLVDLENKLSKLRSSSRDNDKNKNGTRVIGCFSAASNITGILADDIATTILLHQYGALAFWDYATAAPYVTLNMNPVLPGNDKAAYKDAIFFSGHKFVGGVQSPGVLIAKKCLFQNETPEGCGGGSVFFVSRSGHRYLQDIEMREEGGTAAIVECVRLGLSVHLKQTVGEVNIQSREEKLTKNVLSFLRGIPEIILLGNGSRKIKRLAVFSFVVKHPRSVYLHHNFVCSVLNDVFGIQARGGCACAGPYAHDLLGIGEDLTDEYENALVEDSRLDRHHLRRKEEYSQYEMLRPGFTRISLPYFITDSDLTFILEAIKLVATEGWKLLPQYILNPETAEWKHQSNTVFRDRKWLGLIKYTDGKMTVNERKISGLSPFPQDNNDCLQTAKTIFTKARRIAQKNPLPDQMLMFDSKMEKLRWFLLPSEAQDLLLGNRKKFKTSAPFDPRHFHLSYIHRDKKNGCKSNDIIAPDEEGEKKCMNKSELPSRHSSLSVLDAINELPRLQTYSDCGVRCKPFIDISPSASCSSPADGRIRCQSLESPTRSSSSKKIAQSSIYRQCSCGSQTDVSDSDSIITKDGYFSGDFSESGDMGINNLFPQSDNEHIKAYVKGVTEELATEIKSEIRGVIAKVDDALSESSESLENGSQYAMDKRFSVDSRISSSSRLPSSSSSSSLLISRNNSIPTVGSRYYHRSSADIYSLSKDFSDRDSLGSFRRSCRKRISSCNGSINGSVEDDTSPVESSSYNDSVSDQVAFYLAELTSEMVTEMKSEFREMVNAVDEIISPSASGGGCDKNSKIGKTDSDCKKKSLANGKFVEKKKYDIETTTPTKSVITRTVVDELDLLKVADASKENEKPISDNENSIPNRLKESRISDSSNDSGVGCKKSDDSEGNDGIDGLPNTTAEARTSKTVVRTRKVSLLKEFDYAGTVLHDSTSCSMEKRKRSFECVSINPKWHCPPKSIWKPMVDAIREFDMIREGDSVLVCLSGGKDSLSLLHSLHQYQYYALSNGLNFTLGAVTVDPGSAAYDPRPLIPYLHALGVHYLYEEQRIMEKAEEVKVSSICSFCSRLKRGRLYKAARSNNYNVLALGQHLDDSAESFLMSVFHNARLRSMKAHYYISNRDLRVTRPFIYVREKHLRQFAENRKLPVIAENCPACFEAPKERYRMKQLLAQQEILHPRLFANVKSAMHPLISFHFTGQEKNLYREMAANKTSSFAKKSSPIADNNVAVEDIDDYCETDEEDPPPTPLSTS